MEQSRLFLEAIALRRCVEATYNRMALKLAPHILYTKHGDLFIDAVTIERDGAPPREVKIGTFKVAGLKDTGLGADSFEMEPMFDANDPKYAGVTLFAVEPA